jgi:hypothetical protein
MVRHHSIGTATIVALMAAHRLAKDQSHDLDESNHDLRQADTCIGSSRHMSSMPHHSPQWRKAKSSAVSK